jgi:hypothetical protein
MGQRLGAAVKAGLFYAKWYPKQWLPVFGGKNRHLRFVARASRKLARSLFHAMLRSGPKLEREQLLLGRFVEIATELFAITATCLRADQLIKNDPAEKEKLIPLVEYFCKSSRLRIEEKFRGLRVNADRAGYKLAQQVLAIPGKKAPGPTH